MFTDKPKHPLSMVHLIDNIRDRIVDQNTSHYQILRISELFAIILSTNHIPNKFVLDDASLNSFLHCIYLEWALNQMILWIDIYRDHILWGHADINGNMNPAYGPMEHFSPRFLSYFQSSSQ